MVTRHGPPSDLTPCKIRRILAWHARREAFKQRHGSIQALALRLRISSRTVYHYIECYRRNPRALLLARRRPVAGLDTVHAIVSWYRARERFMASRGSVIKFAQALGVKPARIFACIRRAAKATAQRNSNPANRLPNKPGRYVDQVTRSELLRRWPRVELPSESAPGNPTRSRCEPPPR
jgi:hypothetical protein